MVWKRWWFWAVAVVLGAATVAAMAGAAGQAADAVDDVVPSLLGWIAAIGGGPLCLLGAALWRRLRPARAVVDLIIGTQRLRRVVQRVAPEAMSQVDVVLAAAQRHGGTARIVERTKKMLKARGRIKSVTGD